MPVRDKLAINKDQPHWALLLEADSDEARRAENLVLQSENFHAPARAF